MLRSLSVWWAVVTARFRAESESGMATAELLGNAALGVAALVLIWLALQALGVDIVEWIRSKLLSS